MCHHHEIARAEELRELIRRRDAEEGVEDEPEREPAAPVADD